AGILADLALRTKTNAVTFRHIHTDPGGNATGATGTKRPFLRGAWATFSQKLLVSFNFCWIKLRFRDVRKRAEARFRPAKASRHGRRRRYGLMYMESRRHGYARSAGLTSSSGRAAAGGLTARIWCKAIQPCWKAMAQPARYRRYARSDRAPCSPCNTCAASASLSSSASLQAHSVRA